MLESVLVYVPPKKTPKEPSAKSTSLYVPLDLLKQLDEIASELDMSRSELVSDVLRNWAAEYATDKDKPQK